METNKKARRGRAFQLESHRLTRLSSRCLENFALLDTRCAHAHPYGFPIDLCTDNLDIGKPAPTRSVVRMAYVIAANGLFAANFTHSCHKNPFFRASRGKETLK